MPKSAPAPLPLAPLAPPAELFTAAAHALCRERAEEDDTTPTTSETDTAIKVLARHAPPSDTQRRGVHLAQRIIDDVDAGRRGPANLSGTGTQRPLLSDFIVAATDHKPFTCSELIDTRSPYVRLNPKRTAAAHNIHGAVNKDPRFRRHERGVYTRVHYGTGRFENPPSPAREHAPEKRKIGDMNETTRRALTLALDVLEHAGAPVETPEPGSQLAAEHEAYNAICDALQKDQDETHGTTDPS